MGFWSALCSMLRRLIQVPNVGSPPAPSLLGDILHEPLGHRLPLPHVPRLIGYASEPSTDRRRHFRLTSTI